MTYHSSKSNPEKIISKSKEENNVNVSKSNKKLENIPSADIETRNTVVGECSYYNHEETEIPIKVYHIKSKSHVKSTLNFSDLDTQKNEATKIVAKEINEKIATTIA